MSIALETLEGEHFHPALKNLDVRADLLSFCNKQMPIATFDKQGKLLEGNEAYLNLVGDFDNHSFDDVFKAPNAQPFSSLVKALEEQEVKLSIKPNRASAVSQYFKSHLRKIDDELFVLFGLAGQTSEQLSLKTKICDSVNRTLAVIHFQPDGTIISANEHFLSTVGYRADEVEGKHHCIFVDAEYANSSDYEAFWQRLASGESFTQTFARIDAKGNRLWLFGIYTPILDADGVVEQVVKMCFDVTKDKEQELDYQAKLTALDKSQAVIEFTPKGEILSANSNFLATMGYEIGQVVGKHHRMFVTQKEGESDSYVSFWKELGSGAAQEGQFLRINAEGEPIYIQGIYTPVLNANGDVAKVVKFCRDISENIRLRERAEKLFDAVDANNATWEIDLDHRILEANQHFIDAMGFELGEIEHYDERKLMLKADINDPDFIEDHRQLRLGKSVSKEIRRLNKQGREIWFKAIFQPILDIKKHVEKILVIAQDITEEKLTAIETQAKLNAVERSEAVIEFTPSGEILRANDNFLKLMEYDKSEIQGSHHRIFVTPKDVESSEYQNFWSELARGEYVCGEFKRVAKSGREVWIQASYNPVFDLHGQVVKVVKYATDITQRKLEGAENSAKLQAMDKSLAVIEFDLEGNVLNANHNFLGAMGYTLKEIQGHHHSIFCSGDYVRSEEYRTFWLDLSEGKSMQGRFHRVGKFDRDVWIQATYNPIYDLNGDVCKVVKYAYDITKEMQLENLIIEQSKTMSKHIDVVYQVLEASTENIGAASQVSERAETCAVSGEAMISNIYQSWNSVRDTYDRISDMIGRIGDISGQTNLLAFNAAVEASRAGQHGVGFSVVAAEVRRLAEDSSKAAENISQLVNDVKHGIEKGFKLSEQATDAFQTIVKSVSETRRLIELLESAQEQQKSSAYQVHETLNQLMLAVEDNERD